MGKGPEQCKYDQSKIIFIYLWIQHFTTTPFHLVLSSAALVELAKSIPVHSLILSSYLFFCLPFFFFLALYPAEFFPKPEDLETCPNHISFCFLTKVRGLSYFPIAAWIFLTWSLYKRFSNLR